MTAPAPPLPDTLEATDILETVEFCVTAQMPDRSVNVPGIAYRVPRGWIFHYSLDTMDTEPDPPCIFVPHGTISFWGKLMRSLYALAG